MPAALRRSSTGSTLQPIGAARVAELGYAIPAGLKCQVQSAASVKNVWQPALPG
jgi:hypothetical protein